MSQPVKITPEASQPTVAPGRCGYCGAPLVEDFYFCLTCATPYKNVEEVLPRLRPEPLTDGVLIERKAPHVASLFWTYFAVVVGVAVVSHVLFTESRPDLAMFLQMVALFVATCVFAALHWSSLSVQFKRLGLTSPAALWALLALAPLLVINYFYHGWLVREMGIQDRLPLGRLRDAGFSEGALILFFCAFPAVIEEIAFRGLVQHWLQVAIKPWHALVLASALFTTLHFSIFSFPYIFAVGLVLGYAKWKTGSLYPSMIIHFVHNLVVVEMFGW